VLGAQDFKDIFAAPVGVALGATAVMIELGHVFLPKAFASSAMVSSAA
jgi:hypothetical protein